jgi:hypothetical protein
MALPPTTVTLVHCGQRDGAIFAAEVDRVAIGEMILWTKLHVPDHMLVDMADICNPDRDSRDANTTRTVIEQDGFAEVVSIIVQAVNGHDETNIRNDTVGDKWLITSTTGYHRADVVANVAASYLNRIYIDGHRAYNVQTFPFHGFANWGRREIVRATRDCLYLSCEDHPEHIDAPGCTQRDMFGYDAVTSSPAALANFDILYNVLAGYYQLGDPDDDRHNPIQSSKKRKRRPISPQLAPRPPSVPPPTSAPWRDDDYTPIEPTPLQGAPTDHDWATTDRNIDVWWGVLTDAGVDQSAVQMLFCLAQIGDDGYRAANHIVSSLLTHINDEHGFVNVSAFVYSSSKKARQKITPKDW